MQTELLLTSKDKKIKNISFELFKCQSEFKKVEQQYKERKSELQSQILGFISKRNIKDFGFTIGNHSYKFSAVKPKKVIFDVEKLEKQLDKEILDEVIVKEYKITDMDNLIKYLKSCGVNPKKFKKFIEVKKTVDQNKISELADFGMVTQQDLYGCYTVSESEGYIKISDFEIEE